MLTLETAQITQGSFTLHADLTLAPAQTYAVIGPSGAGKSTLLGALCGFIPLRSGRLLWQGKDITQAAPGARPMTMLFQDNNLFPHLSVMQNVGLGLRPDLRLGTAEQTRVHEALDRVGLQGMAARKPAELSGGQQSRVALARVLVQARPLVLLDEPFAGIDPLSISDIRDLVKDLKTRGIGVLITDHNVRETLGICDRAYILNEGQMLTEGRPEQIISNPDVKRVYLGQDFSM